MVDHLVQAIVLVEDLGDARRHLESRGFGVLEGGRHPGRGTANLIVPFGEQYLELLAVVDESEAAASSQGRPVLDAFAARGPGLARWSVETADIDAVAQRVGEPVERRHRTLPDGRTVRWRAVAVDRAWAEPWRCAFMSWGDPVLHPARSPVVHPNGATGFARLEVVTPSRPLALTWMGGHVPGAVVLAEGPRPGVTGLHLSSPTGEIRID